MALFAEFPMAPFLAGLNKAVFLKHGDDVL